jgi:hypothetical protein
LLSEEVDALLVGFACVGKCSTKPIEAAIRRGVRFAEEKTGFQKPVLLCIMGAEGTISIEDESGNENGLIQFPAFRFPESAVSALGRIMKYVEYRRKPTGKLVWYKDVKAGEARNLIQKELDKITIPQSISNLGKETSITLLKYFGIEYAATQPWGAPVISIRIKPDPLFGPLIEINISETKSVLRITPLTDIDLDETIQEFIFQEKKGISEVIGRLSQMIEEIPWLWEFQAKIAVTSNPLIVGEILLNIKSGGAERPSY